MSRSSGGRRSELPNRLPPDRYLEFHARASANDRCGGTSELHSRADEIAARVVAAGGGILAVIDATSLRSFENIVRLIDPAILKRALDNDSLEEKRRPPP